MTINLTKSNLPQLEQFIKLLKPISIGCAGLAIAGLAIYPLIHTKTPEKPDEKADKIEKVSNALPPAPYTIIMGKSKSEVAIKFHNQSSELLLRNVSADEYNCLLNGGGVNCVLKPAYQPKLEVVKAAPQTEAKQQNIKLHEIEISGDMMDNIIVVSGVVFGLLLLNRFRR